jgi:hypothetical protein
VEQSNTTSFFGRLIAPYKGVVEIVHVVAGVGVLLEYLRPDNLRAFGIYFLYLVSFLIILIALSSLWHRCFYRQPTEQKGASGEVPWTAVLAASRSAQRRRATVSAMTSISLLIVFLPFLLLNSSNTTRTIIIERRVENASEGFIWSPQHETVQESVKELASNGTEGNKILDFALIVTILLIAYAGLRLLFSLLRSRDVLSPMLKLEKPNDVTPLPPA